MTNGSDPVAEEPPAHRYDVALLDLDGVVYLGSTAIPDVPEALAEVRKAGMRLAFVTNNASRTPAAVAEMLSGMGVQATEDEVVNSAQAACHVLAETLPPGAKVLVVGTTGLIEAARERGFTLVESADDEPAAVVQGYGPNVGWQQLAEATVAVRRGAWFVATNLDATVPSPRGPMRYQASSSPFPLIAIVPRGSHRNSPASSSYVARVIWIRPGVPWDSMRLAVFTASPQRS